MQGEEEEEDTKLTGSDYYDILGHLNRSNLVKIEGPVPLDSFTDFLKGETQSNLAHYNGLRKLDRLADWRLHVSSSP